MKGIFSSLSFVMSPQTSCFFVTFLLMHICAAATSETLSFGGTITGSPTRSHTPQRIGTPKKGYAPNQAFLPLPLELHYESNGTSSAVSDVFKRQFGSCQLSYDCPFLQLQVFFQIPGQNNLILDPNNDRSAMLHRHGNAIFLRASMRMFNHQIDESVFDDMLIFKSHYSVTPSRFLAVVAEMTP